jgi:hypothetical protein
MARVVKQTTQQAVAAAEVAMNSQKAIDKAKADRMRCRRLAHSVPGQSDQGDSGALEDQCALVPASAVALSVPARGLGATRGKGTRTIRPASTSIMKAGFDQVTRKLAQTFTPDGKA